MKMLSLSWRKIALVSAGLLLAVSIALAAVPMFDLSWWTVDGGSRMHMTGGAFSVSGTAGQPDTVKMTGGEYVLQGGFWVVGPPGATAARAWEDYR